MIIILAFCIYHYTARMLTGITEHYCTNITCMYCAVYTMWAGRERWFWKYQEIIFFRRKHTYNGACRGIFQPGRDLFSLYVLPQTKIISWTFKSRDTLVFICPWERAWEQERERERKRKREKANEKKRKTERENKSVCDYISKPLKNWKTRKLYMKERYSR